MSKLYYVSIVERIDMLNLMTKYEVFNSEQARDRYVRQFLRFFQVEDSYYLSAKGEATFDNSGCLKYQKGTPVTKRAD